METLFFVVTAFLCSFFVFLSEKNRKLKHEEMECFHKALDRLIELQEYIDRIERSLREQKDHTVKCILYRAVHVCEPICCIRIDVPGNYVQFRDVHIIDVEGKKHACVINRNTKQSWGYRISPCSIYEEDHKPLIIDLKTPVLFKYIYFEKLICNNNGSEIVLVMKNSEKKATINKKKHVLCNTFF